MYNEYRRCMYMPRRIRMRLDLEDKIRNYNVEITPVTEETIPELAGIMLDAYRDTVDYEGEDLKQTEDELGRVFRGLYGPVLKEASHTIWENGEAAASVLVCLFKHEPTITYTFTRKASKRKGYATALINKAEEELLKQGYRTLHLFVTLENRDAVNLYESLGFYEVPVTTVTEIITG